MNRSSSCSVPLDRVVVPLDRVVVPLDRVVVPLDRVVVPLTYCTYDCTIGENSNIRTAYHSEHLSSPPVFAGGPCCSSFEFLCSPVMCLYALSSVLWCPLRFPYIKQCSVRLYLQLFVAGVMTYLRYLCFFAHSVVFLFCLSSSCVPYVASFSGLSIFDCPFDIL